MTPTKHDLWKSFPCIYVRCLKDQAMVPTEQDFYIDRLKHFRPDTKVKEIEADHVPFASVPDDLAKVMEDVVEELRVEK